MLAARPLKILIVEDDPDARRVLNLVLRSHGYETAFASESVTAVTIARRECPDLVVLDLSLPGGDGFVILSRMQALSALACVPVIVVSANDRDRFEQKALDAGALAYLQKPVEAEDLIAAVETALESVGVRTSRQVRSLPRH